MDDSAPEDPATDANPPEADWLCMLIHQARMLRLQVQLLIRRAQLLIRQAQLLICRAQPGIPSIRQVCQKAAVMMLL